MNKWAWILIILILLAIGIGVYFMMIGDTSTISNGGSILTPPAFPN